MRVLVFGAGGPAGINVVRSLAEAGHDVVGADGDAMHLHWAAVYCREVMQLDANDVDEVNRVGADAIHSQTEPGVWWVAHNRDKLSAATLCPPAQVVALSQDKWEACLQFRRAGLREDRVHLVQDMGTLLDAVNDLGCPFWLRARHGAGARGSALCNSRYEAQHWYSYWRERDSKYDFIAEAYLPGRDLAWTSLWCEGELIASFGRERLEYIYPRLAPSGRTGTPTIARTVHDPLLNEIAMKTVMAIDSTPHGFYSVDLREDERGMPRPTEVNAGRCFTTSYLSTAAGLNFMDLWCGLLSPNRELLLRSAQVEPLNSIPEGLTYMRHIDCPTLLLDDTGTDVRERVELQVAGYPPEYME